MNLKLKFSRVLHLYFGAFLLFLPVYMGIRNLVFPYTILLLFLFISFLFYSVFRKDIFTRSKYLIIVFGIAVLCSILKLLSFSNYEALGRYLFEPLLLFVILRFYISYHFKILIFSSLFFLVGSLFVYFYNDEIYDLLRLAVYSLTNADYKAGDIYFFLVESRHFTSFSSTTLLILPVTVCLFLFSFNSEVKNHIFRLFLYLIIYLMAENTGYVFMLIFIFREIIARYRILVFFISLIIYSTIGFIFSLTDFRFKIFEAVIRFGEIFRFDNIGNYPHSWTKASRLFNNVIINSEGEEAFMGIHNHVLSFPLNYGFLGLLVAALIFLLLVSSLKNQTDPTSVSILLFFSINMLFHNDGLIFMPFYWVFYYAVADSSYFNFKNSQIAC